MFDFFKDTYAELNGLDVDKMKEERKEKRNKSLILSRSTKIIIGVVGVLYLVMAGVNISMLLKNGFSPVLFKYGLLSILDISIIITMLIKNKEAEIASIIGIVIFVIIHITMKSA